MFATRPSALRRLLSGALAAAFSLAAPDALAAGAKLRLVKRLWGTGEVRLVDGGHERLLERYPEPISVQATEVSPDGHWAFVWYYTARPPLQLSIYDLRTMRRTARFAPSRGGEMHFTPGGNIVHDWGCGTNCAVFALYDVLGKKLLTVGSSGIDISPTRRFALTAPSLFAADEPVVVYDLDAGRKVYTGGLPRGDSLVLDKVRWNDPHGAIQIGLHDLHGKARRMVVRTDRAVGGTASLSVRRRR